MRERISPARRRSIASGLTRISERSTAIERGSLLRAPPPPGRSCLEGRELDGGRLDRRLAVRADLPERLERRLAVHARLLQLRRADRADEEVALDLRATHGALELTPTEPRLHLLDLELALAHVVEVLRRAQQDVDDDADDRDETEDHGHPHHPRVLDAPACVLVDPVGDRNP